MASDVLHALRDWSATAGSNLPSDATTVGAGLADNLQQIQATVRQALASIATTPSSTASPSLAAADGYYVSLSGTTTITGAALAGGAADIGLSYKIHFQGAPIITHNATSLILPGAANIQAAAGDVMEITCISAGNWRCTNYIVAASAPSSITTAVTAQNLSGGTIAGSVSVTMTSANPGVVTETAHGRAADAAIVFFTTGALPTNVVSGTVYYVLSTGLAANSYSFAATIGGTGINTTSGVQSGAHTVAGADALTTTITGTLVDGLMVRVRANTANTLTNPTLAVNGGTARTIFREGGVALQVGDIRAIDHELIFVYKSATTRFELLNPISTIRIGTVVPITTADVTEYDITGIPAGTKLIILTYAGVSSEFGEVDLFLQLGDSGGMETSGYTALTGAIEGSTASIATSSARFPLAFLGGAANLTHGTVTLTLLNASTNLWGVFGCAGNNVPRAHFCSGSKALTGTLDRIRFGASNWFDAGSLNIIYQ